RQRRRPLHLLRKEPLRLAMVALAQAHELGFVVARAERLASCFPQRSTSHTRSSRTFSGLAGSKYRPSSSGLAVPGARGVLGDILRPLETLGTARRCDRAIGLPAACTTT